MSADAIQNCSVTVGQANEVIAADSTNSPPVSVRETWRSGFLVHGSIDSFWIRTRRLWWVHLEGKILTFGFLASQVGFFPDGRIG